MNIKITKNRISEILNKSKGKKFAIIGDVMLDKYVYGEVNRISPEAPVQVVDVQYTEFKLGGAANVAHNIKSLGCEPVLIGVTGDDLDGDIYQEAMMKLGMKTDGIFKDNERPTTVKTRVIASSQHILRIDHELKMNITGKLSESIIKYFEDNIYDFDSIILQDYNKGLLSKRFIENIQSIALKAKKNIYVDPKFDNFFEYKNVTIFKPNRKEIQDVMGIRIEEDDSAVEVGKKLLDIMKCNWLIITRGEKGMMLFDKDNSKTIVHNIPTRARKVADVSGAGDTVISTLAVSICGGAEINEAVMTANQAAGLVCEEVGIVPIYKENLIESFDE